MKEKSNRFCYSLTKALGEAQKEDIIPNNLEAPNHCQEEEINIGKKKLIIVNEEVSTGSTKVESGTASKRGQREGKAPMVEEDIQATHKTKEQIRQEEAGLEEAIKLQAQMYEEKNQGTWKLSQLKKLSFEEIKEEFDKLVQQIDTFVPMDFEATKAKLKRYGEELQTKTSKKQKIDDKDVPAIGEKVDEVKEEEPVKRTGKRKIAIG
ncbi:hypothetical protein Tco_0463059 [Tanacetum coccineum]